MNIVKIPHIHDDKDVFLRDSSVFQTHWHALITAIALPRTSHPRTYSAALCMYGVNEIASYRRGDLSLPLPRTSSHHAPRTSSATLRMYGANEIASYKRMFGMGLTIK